MPTTKTGFYDYTNPSSKLIIYRMNITSHHSSGIIIDIWYHVHAWRDWPHKWWRQLRVANIIHRQLIIWMYSWCSIYLTILKMVACIILTSIIADQLLYQLDRLKIGPFSIEHTYSITWWWKWLTSFIRSMTWFLPWSTWTWFFIQWFI
jgi:hypothetical protein